MCGRFAIHTSVQEIMRYAKVTGGRVPWQPNYNIAPSQTIPIVLLWEASKQITLAKWGLIPFWAKDRSIGNKLINARAETIDQKPSFKSPFRHKRCLIPANGFFEWDKHTKQPYYIKPKHEKLFFFAGLWDTWQGDDESNLISCTIITTDANKPISPYHARMPVILAPDALSEWTDTPESNATKLKKLLISYPAEEIELYPVSKMVNSVKNNSPELIQPLSA
jgi:putative SOS response-associated peptidase YedK